MKFSNHLCPTLPDQAKDIPEGGTCFIRSQTIYPFVGGVTIAQGEARVFMRVKSPPAWKDDPLEKDSQRLELLLFVDLETGELVHIKAAEQVCAAAFICHRD